MLHNNFSQYNSKLYYNTTPFNTDINSTFNKNVDNTNLYESNKETMHESNENTKSNNDTNEKSNSSKDRSTLFGLPISTDDIIIIGLVIFLFLENKKDYLLITVLGLMLFDVSIDSLNNTPIIKNLFNS